MILMPGCTDMHRNERAQPHVTTVVDDSVREEAGGVRMHMCGTRRAADGWHSECSDALEGLGFQRGQSSACRFLASRSEPHHERAQRRLHNGRSKMFPQFADWFKKSLEEQHKLKEAARLGRGRSDDREGRVLNRIISWSEKGLA